MLIVSLRLGKASEPLNDKLLAFLMTLVRL